MFEKTGEEKSENHVKFYELRWWDSIDHNFLNQGSCVDECVYMLAKLTA